MLDFLTMFLADVNTAKDAAAAVVTEPSNRDFVSAIIGGLIMAVPFAIKEFIAWRKAKPLNDAQTITLLRSDLDKALNNYRHLGGLIRGVEETSDRRYRKFRNYVLDLTDVVDDLIPMLERVPDNAAAGLVDRINVLQAQAKVDVEHERQVYENETGQHSTV